MDSWFVAFSGFNPALAEDLMRSFRGSQVGVGLGVGLVEDNVGLFEVQACWVPSRTPDILVTGGLGRTNREAFLLVASFVETHASTIGACMGVSSDKSWSLSMRKPGCQLHIHMADSWKSLESTYQMGAIFICLVSLLVDRPCRTDTMVFGDINNEGYFIGAWRWDKAMTDHAVGLGVRRVVVPEGTPMSPETKRRAAEEEPDGKVRLEIITISSVRELLPLCFDMY